MNELTIDCPQCKRAMDKAIVKHVWEEAWHEMREAFDLYDIDPKIFERSMSRRFESWFVSTERWTRN
jgi:hypothetical protein